MKENWKEPAIKILFDIQFKNKFIMFDKDNIQEEVMLEAFEFLNRPSFDNDKVSNIYNVLGKLISW